MNTTNNNNCFCHALKKNFLFCEKKKIDLFHMTMRNVLSCRYPPLHEMKKNDLEKLLFETKYDQPLFCLMFEVSPMNTMNNNISLCITTKKATFGVLNYIEGKNNVLADAFLQLPIMDWSVAVGDSNVNNKNRRTGTPINFHTMKVPRVIR